MAVYVDQMQPCIPNENWPWPRSCHLAADTAEELHTFAEKLGLKRSWFQDHKKLPHYDLTSQKRRKAVELGAVEITAMQLVRHLVRGEPLDDPQTDLFDVGEKLAGYPYAKSFLTQ